MGWNTKTEPDVVLSCAQIKELDRKAAEEFGIPTETLMENAGRAVAEESIKFLETAKIKKPWKILVFCGGGNNGGDGLVAARLLKHKGNQAKIFLLKPAESFRGASLINFEKIKVEGIPFLKSTEVNTMEKEIRDADLLIDALLGTGFKGKVTGLFQEAIERMNRSGKPILAVDVPSGLDADSGNADGECVRALITVTMGAMKTGFLSTSAKEWIGDVKVADIGFPQELFETLKNKIRR